MKNNYEKIIRDYITAYNNFDVNGMTKDMADNIEFINVTSEEITLELNTKEDFILQAEEATHIFKEREQTILNIYIEGNTAEVELNYRGVIGKDVMESLKTDDIIEVKGKSFFTFNEAGKISSLKDIS